MFHALLPLLGICAVSAFTPQQASRTRFGVSNRHADLPPSNVYNSVNIDGSLSQKYRYTRIYAEDTTASDSAEEVVEGGPRLIIAGAPASGKGTQCELIKDKYGVVHLSTGDMLRAAVAAKSEVGTLAKEYMDAGKLVPDEVIIGVVKDRLNESDCAENGWLLDGFPRTPAQADALAEAGISADSFIFLNVPDESLIERVVGRRTDPVTGKIYHMTFSPPDDEEILARLEQRSDDTEEKVKVRLEQFHANVEAVKGSYSEIAFEVDGTQKPDEVSTVIMDAIDKVLA